MELLGTSACCSGGCLLVDVVVCGVECDRAVALIEYGNNCGCGPVIWCVLREF